MKNNNLEDLLECIGKNLYTIRHQRDEKIEMVARAVGVSHPVLSKIENGLYKSLSIKMLFSFADYYSISISDIIKK